jgi:hypothetical protein
MFNPARPRKPSGVFDWITSNVSLDSTGLQQTGGAILGSWNSSQEIAAGSMQTILAAVVTPTPMSSTPSVGRLRIDEVRGSIFVAADQSTAGTWSVAVGIYVSELNNTTSLWHVRNCLVSADVARDDYLYLEGKTFFSPNFPATSGATVCQEWVRFDLSIPTSITIGGGQALAVTIACQGGAGTKDLSALPTLVETFFRTRIGAVA